METLTFNLKTLLVIKKLYPNCVYYDMAAENDYLILWDDNDEIIDLLPVVGEDRLFFFDKEEECYVEL